jgi:hypothetical protein
MSLSNHGSVKAVLAALAVVAAAGVYCELESSPDALESESAETSTAVPAAPEARTERSATAPGSPLARPSTISDGPAIGAAELAPPSMRNDSIARRSRRNADEPLDEAPAEDPVATAAGMLAARLESEPFDPKWSRDAEGRLLEHFAGLAGEALAEARCRSSVCRVELAFESEAARDDGLASLTLPWDSVGVYQMDEADPRNLILYTTRQPEDVLPRG